MYNLPTTVDPNKVFLIKRSELEGRIDAAYIAQKLKTKRKYNYPTEKLNKLVRSLTGGTPSKEKPEYWDGDIYWVSPKDFKQFYINKSEDTITELGLNNSSTKLIPANSILIVVRSGVLIHTLPVAINTIPVTINQDIKALIPTNKILPEYLGYYFNVFNRAILPLIVKHSTTVQSVNTNEFDRLEIPVPPIKDQQLIVNILNGALSEKQQKEAEAKALLASIDTYLLGELGISLPEQDNSLRKRIFTKRYSELAGERLDSIFYASDLMRFYSGKYPSVSLKSVSISFKSGIGAGKQDQAIDQNGIVQIRPTNIDENGLLKFDRNIYLPFEAKADTLDVDDVLFNNTNSQELVGKTAILKEQKELCYSNHITRIKVDQNKLVPDYLWVILNVYQKNKVFYSICTNWNNQSGIGLELLKSLKIPVPPLEKQTEIANHIQNIHRQAKALQHDAARVLEEAKREVEKMILGE